MQALITGRAGHPDNDITSSISSCDPGRAAAALTLAPGRHNRGRICRRNSVGPDRAGVVMKGNIRSLASVIRDSRRSSINSGDVGLVDDTGDATEVIAIDQVGIAIFPQGKHKLGRRSSRHIDHRRTDASEIGVAIIEREPVRWRPVVGGLTGPSRPSLQTDDCFAAHPVATRIKRVACDHEHVGTIARHTPMSPNAAANGWRGPATDIRRIIDIHAHNPTMIGTAVSDVP